jgi:glutamine cyclotransferase
MKKYIIIGLLLLVGGVFLLKPLFTGSGEIDPTEEVLPAIFKFEDNLATVSDEKAPIVIIVNTDDIEKLELYYNDSILKTWKNPKGKVNFTLDAGLFGVGTRTLNLLSTLKDGSSFVDNRMVRVLSDIVPVKKTAQILGEFPHDPSSFTQGLAFYNGKLYEGTGDPGNQGKTIVAEVDLSTGEVLNSMGLQAGYFGEGVTILNDKVYQLTWKNQKCYVYDVKTLQLLSEFDYKGEGWGLTHDGTSLIMSDGTERIVFRDPKTFAIERTIEVYNNQGPINYLNELEYIDGKVYANVWTTAGVAVFDPKTGKVLEEIDGSELFKLGRGTGEVLNGIAHNPATGKTYMTGKNWIKMFEVKFTETGK